jgi:protease YdgD
MVRWMSTAPGALLTGMLVSLLALAAPAAAAGGEQLNTPIFKTSESYVKSLLDQEGLSPETTVEGDVAVQWRDGDRRFPGLVAFDRLNGGKIWNLRMAAVLPDKATEDMDTAELLEFANRWNRIENVILLYVNGGHTLVAEHGMLVEYGINPQEFRENGLRRLERTLGRILDQLAEFASTYKSTREKADTRRLPAQAVGLLEMEDGAVCTASVVAPDVILTAAHCLFDVDNGRIEAKRFRAGYADGRAVAEAGIRDDYVPPQFDFGRSAVEDGTEAYDWAFLRLDRAIGGQTGVLAIKPLSRGDLAGMIGSSSETLIRVGYGGGKNPSMQRGCRLAHVWSDNIFAHLCYIEPGDSGSPDLVLDRGAYSIVGIDTAILDVREVKRANVAISSGAFAGALQDFMSRPPAPDTGMQADALRDRRFGQQRR